MTDIQPERDQEQVRNAPTPQPDENPQQRENLRVQAARQPGKDDQRRRRVARPLLAQAGPMDSPRAASDTIAAQPPSERAGFLLGGSASTCPATIARASKPSSAGLQTACCRSWASSSPRRRRQPAIHGKTRDRCGLAAPLFSARPHRTNSRRDWQVFFVLEIGLAKGLSRSVIEQNASCDGWGAIDRHG